MKLFAVSVFVTVLSVVGVILGSWLIIDREYALLGLVIVCWNIYNLHNATRNTLISWDLWQEDRHRQ